MDAETRRALDAEARAVLAKHASLSQRTRHNRCAGLEAGQDRILAVQEGQSSPWWIETARGPIDMGYAQRWIIFDRSVYTEAKRALYYGYPVVLDTTKAKHGETVYVTKIDPQL